MDISTSFWFLLFTYGFMFCTQLMGMTKHIALKDFDKNKAIVGLTNELGLVAFLLLIAVMPRFIDVQLLDVDLSTIVNVVLILPLGHSIICAYNKAMELRNIDVSGLDQ